MLLGPVHLKYKKLTWKITKKDVQKTQIHFQIMFLELLLSKNA